MQKADVSPGCFQTVAQILPGPCSSANSSSAAFCPPGVLLSMMDVLRRQTWGIEVFFCGCWAIYTALFRSLRPYINEIILFGKKKIPFAPRGPQAITIKQAERPPARLQFRGICSGRWLASFPAGVPRYWSIIFVALYLGVGVLIGGVRSHLDLCGADLSPRPLDRSSPFLLPSSATSTILDLRIRYEGWEVELADGGRKRRKVDGESVG